MTLAASKPRGVDVTNAKERRFEIIDFEELPATECPCGLSRRALADRADFPGSIHRTQITEDAKLHYHQRLTETYYVLECESNAAMQLDDELISIRPGICLFIPPGVRHRAVGRMTVLIIVFPKFDPTDEVIVD